MRTSVVSINLDNAAAAGTVTGSILLTVSFLVPVGQVALAGVGLLLLLPCLLYGSR